MLLSDLHGLQVECLLSYRCELDSPNSFEIAKAAGISGVRAEKLEELPAAVKTALAHSGPSILDAVTARQALMTASTTSSPMPANSILTFSKSYSVRSVAIW